MRLKIYALRLSRRQATKFREQKSFQKSGFKRLLDRSLSHDLQTWLYPTVHTDTYYNVQLTKDDVINSFSLAKEKQFVEMKRNIDRVFASCETFQFLHVDYISHFHNGIKKFEVHSNIRRPFFPLLAHWNRFQLTVIYVKCVRFKFDYLLLASHVLMPLVEAIKLQLPLIPMSSVNLARLESFVTR